MFEQTIKKLEMEIFRIDSTRALYPGNQLAKRDIEEIRRAIEILETHEE